MEQIAPQSTPTTYNCPACHIVVRSTDYFCFNCGKNLKPVPLNTSIWKQILLYVGSVILAPFGIIWGFRYLRESNAKAKIIGVLCIILTIITCILLTVYAINIINQAQDELHKQLQNVTLEVFIAIIPIPMKESPTYSATISPTFVVIAGLFVCFLMMANIIVNRLVTFGGLVFNGDLFLFPLTYIFGDILTEVYGFKKSRLVIWIGFAANIIMASYFSFVLRLPFPAEFTDNHAFMTVLGSTPLIVLASITAFFFGEYSNSAVLSILKKKTEGKWLWMRTISSTLVGELVDTVLFMTIALHYLPLPVLGQIIVVNYGIKVAYEVAATPFTYAIINRLKKVEHEDTFDYGVTYNPFGFDISKDSKKTSK